MGEKDRAIVVGVNCYPDPDLGDLKGPEDDATAFYDWLRSADGGNVPETQIRKILTSDFKDKMPFPSVVDAQPTTIAVQGEFIRLDQLVKQSRAAGNGPQIGDRLYIYMAGHGFAPSADEAALVMANAIYKTTLNYHVLGKYSSELFLNVGAFKEILLFMDCCRLRDVTTYPNKFYGMTPDYDQEAAKTVKAMHVFAAGFGYVTRETQAAQGGRGIFTKALLEGLKVATDEEGRVTTRTLADHLYNQMKKFMSDADLENQTVSAEPSIFPYPQFPPQASEFVITTIKAKPQGVLERIGQILTGPKVQAPNFPVVIQIPSSLQGKSLDLLDGKLQPVANIAKASAEWKLELARGKYIVRSDGTFVDPTIKVGGIEEGGVLNVSLSAE